MSEICFECLNEELGGGEQPKNYVISKHLDLCEHCGEYKRVVIARRDLNYYILKFRIITYPVIVLFFPLILIIALIIRLYWWVKLKQK